MKIIYNLITKQRLRKIRRAQEKTRTFSEWLVLEKEMNRVCSDRY